MHTAATMNAANPSAGPSSGARRRARGRGRCAPPPPPWWRLAGGGGGGEPAPVALRGADDAGGEERHRAPLLRAHLLAEEEEREGAGEEARLVGDEADRRLEVGEADVQHVVLHRVQQRGHREHHPTRRTRMSLATLRTAETGPPHSTAQHHADRQLDRHLLQQHRDRRVVWREPHHLRVPHDQRGAAVLEDEERQRQPALEVGEDPTGIGIGVVRGFVRLGGGKALAARRRRECSARRRATGASRLILSETTTSRRDAAARTFIADLQGASPPTTSTRGVRSVGLRSQQGRRARRSVEQEPKAQRSNHSKRWRHSCRRRRLGDRLCLSGPHRSRGRRAISAPEAIPRDGRQAADAAAAADALATARRISEAASARNAKHAELRREASRLSGEMTASGEMTRPSPETSFTSVDPHEHGGCKYTSD